MYPKCRGSGIQNNVKPNKLLSVMNVCRHGFENGVIPYNLTKVLLTESGVGSICESNLSQFCTKSIFGNNGKCTYYVLE